MWPSEVRQGASRGAATGRCSDGWAVGVRGDCGGLLIVPRGGGASAADLGLLELRVKRCVVCLMGFAASFDTTVDLTDQTFVPGDVRREVLFSAGVAPVAVECRPVRCEPMLVKVFAVSGRVGKCGSPRLRVRIHGW